MIADATLAALLTRMAAVDADLQTYTATLHAHVALTTFPFLSTDVTGTIYRREPDRERLVVTSALPALAQQFGNLYPHIVSPAAWTRTFAVRLTGEGGGVAHLHLVPIVRGNVAGIDVDVDEASGLVTRMRWNYRNGGYAEMTQSYATIGDDRLPVRQRAHIQEPGYDADVTSTIDGYRLNVPLPAGIFTP